MEGCDKVILRGAGGKARSRERLKREEREKRAEINTAKGKLEKPGRPRKSESSELRDEEKQTQRKRKQERWKTGHGGEGKSVGEQ